MKRIRFAILLTLLAAPAATAQQSELRRERPSPDLIADGKEGVDKPFTPLFDGGDLSRWIIPAGDGGHWKVVDGVIDYDARSEAPGRKDLVSRESFGDSTLKLDWRIKETPYINNYIPYVLPDGTHARGVDGKPLTLSLPDSDSGVFIRDNGTGRAQVNIWCWPIGSGEMYSIRTDPKSSPSSGPPPRPSTRPTGPWASGTISSSL